MAPAVCTFLTGHTWAGKTVVPFQTHGGWPGHTLSDMKKACPGARFPPAEPTPFDSTRAAELVAPHAAVDPCLGSLKEI